MRRLSGDEWLRVVLLVAVLVVAVVLFIVGVARVARLAARVEAVEETVTELSAKDPERFELFTKVPTTLDRNGDDEGAPLGGRLRHLGDCQGVLPGVASSAVLGGVVGVGDSPGASH